MTCEKDKIGKGETIGPNHFARNLTPLILANGTFAKIVRAEIL